MTEDAELVPLSNTLSCYAPNPKEAQFIYKEIFEDHCYDIPNLLPPPPSSGDSEPSSKPFIIDAGANIGLLTVYIKQKYPTAKILAFEPAPQLFELLCRNLRLNNIPFANGDDPHDGSVDDNAVEVFPVGLSVKESEEKLTYYPTLPSNSTLKPEEKVLLHREAVKRSGQEMADHWFGGSYEVGVKLQRLSNFLNKNKGKGVIDLLKVDVEGAELDVLKDLDDEHWGLIQNIVLETMEKSGIKAKIEELLKAKGFEFTIEGAPWAPEEFYTIKAHRETSHT